MKTGKPLINVLMVGVGPKRVGGMWKVAESYLQNASFHETVKLNYVPTSTNGSILLRVLYMLWGYAKILWILHTKHVDIMHIHMAEKGSTFRKGRVAKWGRKNGKKVIIHLHAGPFKAWFDTLSLKNQKKVKQIFQAADKVLVLGEYWKNELEEIIPEDRMRVLYNGVDCPQGNPYRHHVRNIVYFGVMRREKGTYDLIQAISQINQILPQDIKVILCGNDLEGDIQKTIDNKGLQDRFILPGWVDGDRKEEIYGNAMIDVLPSYYEGFSMTILEAMAHGIPVITTNISTMPELLGDEGIMINPGDVDALAEKILSLVNNESERVRLSRMEWERVNERFSTKAMIDHTINIYNELMDNKQAV